MDPGFAHHDDADLWRRAAQGDHGAFAALFVRHGRAVYNLCFRCTADWALAEDLLSATFLHAWRRRGQIQPEGGTARPLLFGIALNLARNHGRGSRREREALARLTSEPRSMLDVADDVAGRLDDQRRMREVLARIRLLPEAERDVFVLCVWQGFTYEDAAEALGVPIGTVRSRLSRARARLREGTDRAEPDPPPNQMPELEGRTYR